MGASAWLRELPLRDPQCQTVNLSAPWGARLPGSGGHPGIYVVASGTATLAVDGRAPVTLDEGDVAVLPQGTSHVIASRADAAVRSVEEFCATASEARDGYIVGGGGGALTELRTLCFAVEGTTPRAVTAFAPSLVVLRAREARPWFSHVVRATRDLVDEEAGASDLAACRLGELLLLEALAGNVLRGDDDLDAPVLRAALLLRSDLSAKWTVSAIARKVGLSRSAFFDRFVRAMGCPPSTYLLRARMEEAAVLLGDGASVDDVAQRLGYEWPSSFTVAFHRFHGVTPSAHRKARRSAR